MEYFYTILFNTHTIFTWFRRAWIEQKKTFYFLYFSSTIKSCEHTYTFRFVNWFCFISLSLSHTTTTYSLHGTIWCLFFRLRKTVFCLMINSRSSEWLLGCWSWSPNENTGLNWRLAAEMTSCLRTQEYICRVVVFSRMLEMFFACLLLLLSRICVWSSADCHRAAAVQ